MIVAFIRYLLEEQIIKMYLDGLSTVKIGKMLGLHYSSVRTILIRNNVTLRSNKNNSRKYKVNELFFDDINTENKAYWLGFIYADGYVTSNKFGIALKDSDSSHLEKLRNDLESDYPIHVYKSNSEWSHNKYCRLLVTSEHLVDTLIKNGVFRRKSNILKPPENIPHDLIRHFIRGYFDGDGGIIRNGNSYYSTFIGTQEFVYWINEVINNEIGVQYKKLEKRHEKDSVVSIKYFGEDCYRVIKYLYNNSNIYLDGKYERYIKATIKFSQLYQ